MRLRLVLGSGLLGSLLLVLWPRPAPSAGGGTPEVLPEATREGAVLPALVLEFATDKPAAYEEPKDLPFEGGALVLKGHEPGQADPVSVRAPVIADARMDKWRRLHLVDGDPKSICYTEMAGYHRYRSGVPDAGRLDVRPYDVALRFGRMALDPKTLAPAFEDRIARLNYLAIEGVKFPATQGVVHAWSAAAAGLAREPSATFSGNASEALLLRLSPVETSRLVLRLTATGKKEQKSFAAREIGVFEVAREPRKDFPALRDPVKASGARVEIPCVERTGVDGAEVTLAASAGLDGVFLLSVSDPGAPAASISRLPFRARAKAGEEVGPIVFDFGDVVADKGQNLAISLEGLGASPASGLSISSCRLARMEPAKAVPEFVEALRKRAAIEYTEGAEGWRWEGRDEGGDLAGPTLDRILALDPENLLAKAYLSRIRGVRRSGGGPRPEVPKPDPASRLQGPAGAPDWAVAARALLRELHDISSWWVDERMLADGQLGGGWNDDCELTFRWTFLGLVADSERFRDALQRYADGIWASGRIDPKTGYCQVPGLWDVEHACEETTCTQPYLVLLRYGDPEYVERNMLTFSNFDFWTGGKLNPRGHRHFRSPFFQGRAFQRGVDDRTAYDHPYCAYALVPGYAAIWYNDHPLAKQWLAEYAKSWVEDIRDSRAEKRRPAKGKGHAVPHNVDWIDCSAKGGRYYPGGSGNLMGAIQAAFVATRDPLFLEPFEKMPERNPDSTGLFADPILAKMAGKDGPAYHARDAEILEAAAGDSARSEDYYRAWLLKKDKAFLARGCRAKLVEALSTRFLNTEADPPTDRAYPVGAELVAQIYLGGHGFDRDTAPYLAVSWEGLGTDFAALVLENDEKRVSALVYSFSEKEVAARVRVWGLAHGKYDVRFGTAGDDDALQKAALDDKGRVLRRGDRIPIAVPPRTLCRLDIVQTEALDDIRKRPDLAVSARDVQPDTQPGRVRVRIHNIGAAPAKNVKVVVRSADGKVLGDPVLDEVAAPLDLKARFVEIAVPREPLTILVDPDDTVPEITEENNTVEIRPAVAEPAVPR